MLYEVTTNMLGWETAAFEDLHLIHPRVTGLAEGLVSGTRLYTARVVPG
jgi:hypothetical protein